MLVDPFFQNCHTDLQTYRQDGRGPDRHCADSTAQKLSRPLMLVDPFFQNCRINVELMCTLFFSCRYRPTGTDKRGPDRHCADSTAQQYRPTDKTEGVQTATAQTPTAQQIQTYRPTDKTEGVQTATAQTPQLKNTDLQTYRQDGRGPDRHCADSTAQQLSRPLMLVDPFSKIVIQTYRPTDKTEGVQTATAQTPQLNKLSRPLMLVDPFSKIVIQTYRPTDKTEGVQTATAQTPQLKNTDLQTYRQDGRGPDRHCADSTAQKLSRPLMLVDPFSKIVIQTYRPTDKTEGVQTATAQTPQLKNTDLQTYRQDGRGPDRHCADSTAQQVKYRPTDKTGGVQTATAQTPQLKSQVDINVSGPFFQNCRINVELMCTLFFSCRYRPTDLQTRREGSRQPQRRLHSSKIQTYRPTDKTEGVQTATAQTPQLKSTYRPTDKTEGVQTATAQTPQLKNTDLQTGYRQDGRGPDSHNADSTAQKLSRPLMLVDPFSKIVVLMWNLCALCFFLAGTYRPYRQDGRGPDRHCADSTAQKLSRPLIYRPTDLQTRRKGSRPPLRRLHSSKLSRPLIYRPTDGSWVLTARARLHSSKVK
ncbi:Hypothetical predicted protein [Mytilus galloprovincialis]|uniref:Uncharacterized protein n=2 Tax=Mytilus galloprovincialis TaxID=29158 RepID=A0A8B6CSS9_MYTGA|nr:Hypothetical predicted protein [Mytilus galloprovincialis]